MIERIIPIFSILLLSVAMSAQKGVELGAWLGSSHYFGDLKTEFSLNEPSLSGGLNFRYNLNERLAAKFSASLIHIYGDDEDSPNTFERNRNLSFRSRMVDLNTQFEFNFLPYRHGSEDEYYTPYVFGGFSVFSYSPKADLNGETYNLRAYGTEGQAIGEEYGRISFAPTLGVGMKWDLNADWSINIEASVRLSNTDYIDDVSTVYPDLALLSEIRGNTAVALSDRSLIDGIGEPGRQRGNNKNNDSYMIFGISIMRYFGSLECPGILK